MTGCADPAVGAARLAAQFEIFVEGYVFHDVFVLGLVEGWPIEWVMRFESMAAAIKCESFGGRLGAPKRGEVEARMVYEGATISWF